MIGHDDDGEVLWRNLENEYLNSNFCIIMFGLHTVEKASKQLEVLTFEIILAITCRSIEPDSQRNLHKMRIFVCFQITKHRHLCAWKFNTRHNCVIGLSWWHHIARQNLKYKDTNFCLSESTVHNILHRMMSSLTL